MAFGKRPREEFQYVVYKPAPARVCFGTSLERNTSPIGKHISGFQRYYATEENSLSPFSYQTEKYKAISNAESAPQPILVLENGERIKFRTGPRAPRFKDTVIRTPSPTRYDVTVKWEQGKKSKYPFGKGQKDERRFYTMASTPGPGTYDLNKWQCRKPLSQDNFGRPTKEDVIEMICTPRPQHECTKCKNICEGDYWHREYTTFLCMLCWWEEKKTSEIYKPKELKLFSKIRNCSFMHRHEGTDAAIRLLPESKLKKKLRLERYLNNYISC